MTWHEISITVPFEYVEPISYLFDRYGHGISLNAHQRKLLEELANSMSVNGRGKEPLEEDGDDGDDTDKGLFDRLKGAFG